jgi:glycosyltransferase involved in cell wall biosynthesis
MKILHLGSGFTPFRHGDGLIEYAEDLMQAQIENKLEVAYFFAGRYYPHLINPSLKIWKRRDIKMYEVINSLIYPPSEHGTAYPEMDLHEHHSENLFRSVLREFKPDILHIQELYGIPSSIIEVAKMENIPTLMTLHDYFPLCPTSNLIDKSYFLCHKTLVGNECASCCALASLNTNHLLRRSFFYLKRTFYYDALILLGSFGFKQPEKKLKSLSEYQIGPRRIYSNLKSQFKKSSSPGSLTDDQKAKKYQKRRDLNIERLSKIDLLLATSSRVAQIYTELGVKPENINTLNLTLNSLANIQPKLMQIPINRINFVTLNGCATTKKGARLIMDALYTLKNLGLTDRFKFFILGNMMSSLKDEFLGFENVVYLGRYDRFDLERLLEGMHVGIVPSIMEEAYGFVGVELLAKGIPVIGNNLGGIVDYTKEGFTGWINVSNTAEGLAKIMSNIIADPEQILHLNRNILQNHETIVKPMARHMEEMNGLYKTLLN